VSLITLVSIAAVGATVAATAAGALQTLVFDRHRRETLETRVDRLTRSLKSASDLVAEIEGEVQKRSALASKLQADIARYNELKQLDAPKIEAVAQALRGEIKRDSSKAFWVGIAINVVFFLLGSAFSYWVALHIH
jgi:hypothetical protein